MASFNDPKITNQIANDVPTIQQLLGYLAQARPDLGTYYPANSIRIRQYDADNDYWAIQVYRDGSWQNMGQFYNNVRLLQGYAPSTSASANKIPVYNASGQLVGNITGNAPTATKLATPRSIQCGGIASSTAQNFDGSANVTIPINQITVNNSADNALNGVVTAAHGGTGRTDGAAQDVVVSSLAGTVKAKEYGQIGDIKIIPMSSTDNIDSLVVTGRYLVYPQFGAEIGYPEKYNAYSVLKVYRAGGALYQELIEREVTWTRYSTDSGASWGGWTPHGSSRGGAVIYLSKSGSNLNTGLEPEYPVLTVDRAFKIADALALGRPNASVTFCFGAGDWGDVSINPKSYNVVLAPYDNTVPTAYSTSLPVFGSIYVYGTIVYLKGICAAAIGSFYGAYISVSLGYKKLGFITAGYYGTIYFSSENAATNLLEIYNSATNTLNTGIFQASYGGQIIISYLHLKLISNNTSNYGLIYVGGGGTIYCNTHGAIWNSTTYRWTGNKLQVNNGGIYNDLGGTKTPTSLGNVPATGGLNIAEGANINGYVYGGALDADVVHKTGDTITGVLYLTNQLIIKNNNVPDNGIPSAVTYKEIEFSNATTKRTAIVRSLVGANGKRDIMIFPVDASNNPMNGLHVMCDANGANQIMSGITPPAANNDTAIPTTAWVRSLLSSNSANEVPVGSICAYEGAFTRATDAAVFFEKQIREISETLQNEEQAARMMRMTRSVEEQTEQMREMQALEDKIFKLTYLKEFYKEMLSRVPENDGVRLFDAKGDPLSEDVAYPEFHIEERAFPNTKWNQYSIGPRFLLCADDDSATPTFHYGQLSGAGTHTHSISGSVGAHTLSASEMPSHNHSLLNNLLAGNANGGGYAQYGTTANGGTGYKGSGNSHTHSLSMNSMGTASNYPPYKAVYWIKKVA